MTYSRMPAGIRSSGTDCPVAGDVQIGADGNDLGTIKAATPATSARGGRASSPLVVALAQAILDQHAKRVRLRGAEPVMVEAPSVRRYNEVATSSPEATHGRHGPQLRLIRGGKGNQ